MTACVRPVPLQDPSILRGPKAISAGLVVQKLPIPSESGFADYRLRRAPGESVGCATAVVLDGVLTPIGMLDVLNEAVATTVVL